MGLFSPYNFTFRGKIATRNYQFRMRTGLIWLGWFEVGLRKDLGYCDWYPCNFFLIGKSTSFSYTSPILMLFMFFTYIIALYIFLNLLQLFLLLGGWILRILGKATKFQPTNFVFLPFCQSNCSPRNSTLLKAC